MIESIEVVKGGHVEKFVMPFDSVPPSLVVVNREGLVKLLEADKNRIDELRRETVKQAKQLWSAASAYSAQTTVLNHLLSLLLPADKIGPLTFQQLMERVGKPVYVKHAGDTTGEWYILLDARNTPWSPNAEPELSIVAGRYVKYDPEKELYYDRE